MTPIHPAALTREVISPRGFALRHATLFLLAASLLLLSVPRAARAASIDTLFVAAGEAAGDHLGAAVAAAGDVNGDGYADVIAGAAGNDAGGLDAGRVYVYFGGPGADAVPDLVFTGSAARARQGLSVGAAGDVNGDGYADVIAGADGRAFVYYGGPGADAVADLALTQVVSLDGFGYSVGTAGDVNGDGYADVIVGAPANPCDIFGRVCLPGEGLAGSAYVYFGGPGADSAPDLTLTGETEGDHFGASVGTAGDVNGDGYADVIVGAPLNGAGGGLAGRAYVYYGGPGMDSTPDLVLTGGEGEAFGSSAGAAGDVNADGYADVIVGAPEFREGNERVGRAYVFLGSPAADAAADLTLAGESPSVYFGVSVGTAGDVNGDGDPDVIVGSSHFIAGSGRPGRVCMYHGGPDADAEPDLVLTAPADDFFGASVGTAGDVDGDGRADLIVGAHGSDAGGAGAGRAYVLRLRASTLEVALDLDPDVLRATGHGAWITAYIQSPEIDPARIDVSTVRLAGIVPAEAEPATVGDHDGDGVSDLMLKFSRDALIPLLAPGANEVQVTGSLISGEPFAGTDVVRLLDAPRASAAGVVAPNPLNPAGGLTFRTTRAGRVTVSLFDIHGRLARRLLDGSFLQPGLHVAPIDGRSGLGGELSSGVYFFRVESPDGAATGRFAILK